MKHMRQVFAQKVEGLENKQSECIQRVADLNESVADLGEKVNDVARDVILMGSGLGEVDAKIDDLNVSRSNIHSFCIPLTLANLESAFFFSK